MSREGPLGTDDEEDPPQPEGTLRPLSYAVVIAWAVAGLVLGWLWHPVAERLSGTAPVTRSARSTSGSLSAALSSRFMRLMTSAGMPVRA